MSNYVINLILLAAIGILLIGIGVNQYRKKDKPISFWTKEKLPVEVENITAYNKSHGIAWIVYGVLVLLSMLVDKIIENPTTQAVILIGVIGGGILLMIAIHYAILRKYRSDKKGE